MQFFCDECCPRALAVALSGLGHDVVHVLDVTRGDPDVQQAEHAFAERRVLISSDYDFGELAVRRGVPFTGLVLLAPHPGGLKAHADVLATRIHEADDELLGQLTILQHGKTRRRPLEP